MKYPDRLKRMWIHVFNSTYKKVMEETGSIKSAEVRAFKSANSILKKNIEKFGYERYGHKARISYLVDLYLQNI